MHSKLFQWLGLAAALASSHPGRALAQPDGAASKAAPANVRDEVPVVAHAQSAFGMRPWTLGAQSFAEGRVNAGEERSFAGGVTVMGGFVDGITALATASRGFEGRFAPSLTVAYRFVGDSIWALAGFARYKAEGFAEIEGEVEAGALASIASQGWSAHLNVLAGRGLEESEADAEAKLRVGRDIASWLWLGLDGRARYRIGGDKELPGGRTWDATGGGQIVGSWERYFAALTAGPSTAVPRDVAWSAMATIGGITP